MLKHYVRIMALLLCPVGVNAATIVALDERELVQRVDAIAFGNIIRTQVKIHPTYGVYTEATVEVYDGLLGTKRGEVLTVLVPGGKPPNAQKAVVSGAPALRAGDRFFAFLEKRNDTYVPWGLAYGWLHVRQSPQGEFFVSRVLNGLYPVDSTGEKVEINRIQLKDIPLRELSTRIRGYIQTRIPADLGQPSGGVR